MGGLDQKGALQRPEFHATLLSASAPLFTHQLLLPATQSALTCSTALAAKSGVPTKSSGWPALSGAHLQGQERQACVG